LPLHFIPFIFAIVKQVYFDNAATTQPDERVVEAMLPWLSQKFGNPSSVHRWGREAKVLVEDTRDLIAEFIGAKPSEIYFTSGGTEANNFALKGIAFSQLGKKNHIISTMIEHSSVLETIQYLCRRFGFKVSYVPTDRYGRINPADIEQQINEYSFLICIMHSNNELGIINDVRQVAAFARDKGIYLHSDSVQSIGKTEFHVSKLGCSTAAISAHKIYGPKGIGALYIESGVPLDKYHHGGKQERDRRGGTENVAAIAGFKKAVELLKQQMIDDIDRYRKLKEHLIAELKNNFREMVTINSLTNGSSLPNIVNLSFNPETVRTDRETILIKLDLKGIAVSSGSACTSGTIKPSHVLKALGYDDATAKSSIRVSFGRYNTLQEVDYFLEGLKEILR